MSKKRIKFEKKEKKLLTKLVLYVKLFIESKNILSFIENILN